MNTAQFVRGLTALCRERGWSMEKTNKGHFKLTKEGCAMVTASGSPSCPFALRKISAMLIRHERQGQLN